MSYEHCDKHDCDATNGCMTCDRERVEVMSDAEVVREAMLDIQGHDSAAAARLHVIAKDLEEAGSASAMISWRRAAEIAAGQSLHEGVVGFWRLGETDEWITERCLCVLRTVRKYREEHGSADLPHPGL